MQTSSPVREEKVKQLRIIEIDRMIRSGSYPNATTLRKHFEVSRSTIMRDIEFLRDRYNAPLEYDADRNGYYYTDPTFFVQSVMLSEAELFSVSVIQPLLEQYRNTPLEASVKNIFSKLTGLLPHEVSLDTTFIGKDISFIADPLPTIEDTTFTATFKAMRSHRTIRFFYRALNRSDYTEHRANPYHVICQKGNWYMLAYDFNHDRITTFSLARFKDIEIEENAFSVPEGFNPRLYFDSSFGVWNNDTPPVKIELLFSKEINTYILERTWHDTQEIRQNDDGTVYLSFLSNQLQETLHWVMHFGSSVRILNPPELAEQVKEEARKILGKSEK